MASSSLAFSALSLHFPSSKLPPSKSLKFKPTLHSIKASVLEKLSIAPSAPPTLLATTIVLTEPKKLPIRKNLEDYKFSLIGPWKDRQDYFYNQGRDEFSRC
ncbi:allene oxide synthase [Abeliophyllum distichum]|uniref:Allene oxide synthase n=1 Tax=Abeliophyllum distichum TaxID=126358 RepID=A0ABD1SY61_9LAMI